MKNHKVLLVILILISLSLFLRIYKLSDIYIFGFDEEYQATYAMTLVKDFHPIWIGVSASYLDYYMGPYFTYFTAFWLMLSGGDPLITAYVAAITGVVTCLVIFFIGWKFFNFTTGVTSSFLYAGLPLFVFYDQKYWNPMFVQLIVLMMFLSLLLIKKSPWWWLLFTASVGAIFETDLAPLPLVIIGIWLFLKGKYFLNIKLVLSCIGIFLLFYWPLIVFDYHHNWSNLTVLGRYSQQAKQVNVKFNPTEKFMSFVDSMGRFWYLKPGNPNSEELDLFCRSERTHPSIWLSILSITLLLFFLRNLRGKERAAKYLAYFLLVSLMSYLLYSGGSFEYYLHGFVTLFVFVPAIILDKKLRPLLFILLFFVLLSGLNTILHTSDKYSLGSKKRLIAKVMTVVSNNSFSIDQMGFCHTYEGWRYLFKVYGKTPVKSFTDQNFAWLYPDEEISEDVDYEVVLAEDRLPTQRDYSDYIKIKRGGYSAYIKQIEKNLNKKSNF